jgi:hypothetical protein
MTQWEYAKLTLLKSNNRGSARIEALALKPDGKHDSLFSQPKGDDCAGEVLAWLGSMGWEMVAASAVPHTGNAFSDPGANGETAYEYLFKRVMES